MPVSSELIERAARAMCAYDVRDTADPERRAVIEWDNESGYYLGFARAALEAALSLPQGAPEWQPIDENTPLDKTVMLWWTPAGAPNRYAEQWVIGQVSSHEPGMWWNPHRAEYQSLSHIRYWQPLPASPDPEGL